MTNIYYIVVATHAGDCEHSYVVGLYDRLQLAVNEAEEHTVYRGGKYLCQIFQCGMNSQVSSDWNEAILYQTVGRTKK